MNAADLALVKAYLTGKPLDPAVGPQLARGSYFVRGCKLYLRAPLDPWLNSRLRTAITAVLTEFGPRGCDIDDAIRQGRAGVAALLKGVLWKGEI